MSAGGDGTADDMDGTGDDMDADGVGSWTVSMTDVPSRTRSTISIGRTVIGGTIEGWFHETRRL